MRRTRPGGSAHETRGIRGASRAKKRFTTHSDKDALRAPDLVHRNFSAARPDQLWVADFTYCSTLGFQWSLQHDLFPCTK